MVSLNTGGCPRKTNITEVGLSSPRGKLPQKRGGSVLWYLSGVKNAVLVPHRVFNLKRYTAEASKVSFRIFNRRKVPLRKVCLV